MALQRTFSIIKPDAVAKNVIGKIYSRFESNGLKIVASKMAWLSAEEAGKFYAVHKERLRGQTQSDRSLSAKRRSALMVL